MRQVVSMRVMRQEEEYGQLTGIGEIGLQEA